MTGRQRSGREPTHLDGRGPTAPPPTTSITALITSCDLNDQWFGWIRATPSAGGITTDPDTKGEFNAFAVNGNPAGAVGKVVRLHFAGHGFTGLSDDEDEQPLYEFVAPAAGQSMTLPNHDHRDNFNGGFAYSCYHPGTALPQQAWGIWSWTGGSNRQSTGSEFWFRLVPIFTPWPSWRANPTHAAIGLKQGISRHS